MKLSTRRIPFAVLVIVTAMIALPHAAFAAQVCDAVGHFDEYSNWVDDGQNCYSVSDDQAATAAEQSYTSSGNDFNSPERDAYGRIVHLTCANGINHVVYYDSGASTCSSASNSCGDRNYGYIVAGSCSAGGAPAERPYYGQGCSASSACGTNYGSYDCNQNCSVGAPGVPGNYGQSCSATSATNACGQANTNYGTYGCGGCSASTPAPPSNAGCNQPPNTPTFAYLYTNDAASYVGSTGNASYAPGYRVYMNATDPNGDNVAIHYQLYNAQTGQIFADNWSENPIWNASGSWTYTANFSNFAPGTYYVRAYSYDTSAVTSNWSDWQPIALVYPALSASCTGTPSSIYEGQTAVWTASVSGGTGSYSYTWGGTDGLSGSGSSVSKAYSTSGTKNAGVTVTSGSQQVSVGCSVSGSSGNVVTVSSCNPSLSASPSTVDLGQGTNLNWSVPSACASSCVFSDGHSVSGQSGSYAVTPPLPSSGNTDNYAITCPSSSSKVAQTTVTVRVPTASITATPNRVHSGDSSTIAWNATNVTSCDITKNGVAWKAGLAANGSGIVTGTAPDAVTTQNTYVMRCVNASGTVQAQAQANAVVNVVPGFDEF